MAAWWGTGVPDAWPVRVPAGVDLLVLDTAPLPHLRQRQRERLEVIARRG